MDGSLGERPLSPRVLDLLDLAGAIYRLESQVPRRPTNPVTEWQVYCPVRDVVFWSRTGAPLLASVLRFLNRAQWTFSFGPRRKPGALSITSIPGSVREIVLFSGGMDSACGAGVHRTPHNQVKLVSFYSNQHKLQQSLAKELEYDRPVQWRLAGRRGKEGMNLIRAFMFLTLGAIVAETFGVSTIFQYENGVLAMAIPPSGSQVPTRHAHPEFHRRMEALLEAVFERRIEIRNPFFALTKREEALKLSEVIGESRAEAVLRQTQTCWQLSQAHVGGQKKRPFVPCGVCTPCIVRRTARPYEAEKGAWKNWRGYAFDPKRPAVMKSNIGTSFRAYLELIGIALQATNDDEMIENLAPEARTLIGGPTGPTEAEASSLLRRFAHEFCDAFEIHAPKPVQRVPK